MSEEIKSSAPSGERAPRERRDDDRPRGGDRGDRGGDRGDRGGDRRGGPGGPGGRPRRRFSRKKLCYFRTIKADFVDYKDADILRRFIGDNGKILPRRMTGTSAKFQRQVCTAIKRARYMALLPYTTGHR